jgi:TetR/AcrR family tetracycline transcriptional repressor
LSRETVVDGALALVDSEGRDGLTIRRLATRLGVTPMALYWHFKNKDELLEALADRLWSLVDLEVDPDLPWAARLRAIMESLVSVLHAHSAAAPVVMAAPLQSASACFDTMEAALGILAEAGFTPAESAAICRHGLRTATTLAIGDPDLTPQQTPEETAERVRHKRITIETLPADRYPCLIQAAAPFATIEDSQAYFDFGIDLFVAGVEALAARRQAT